MKIRDIQLYLQGRCPGSSIERIGSDDEPFLETIYGQDQEVDSTIRDVASFASNSEEQLFYEFVQNAFDANADSLCFFFDEEYLIVLNNGEPFYTDPRSKNPRDGQLYNFLAKGKSIKAGDNTKTGEYGQGSKLLYTLIADKSAASNKTQLLRAIKEEKKGPYIISWKDTDQLNDFRFKNDSWVFCDPHSGENDLLIAKILMTYYPVSPGVDEVLFSDREFQSIRSAFERLVDPKRNINRLSRGTAIIVPLGEGQYEAISAKDNLNRVKIRLGGFASLTSEKERYSGRHLDHIYVANDEVEMHSVRSVFLEFSLDGEDFSYQFAFNNTFAKDNYVSLFKTLPVLQARYKLGFIIDSQNFELDSSRQRINDAGKTGQQLTVAFQKLLEKVKEIRQDNPDLFDYIYTCLLDSRPGKQDVDSQFISIPFYETFTPFIKENIKTDDGSYLPMERVVKHAELSIDIPLSRLGINDVCWVSPEISKGELDRFAINLQEYSLENILADCDKEKLKEWICSLEPDEYQNLHETLFAAVENAADESLASIPLFRSNKGNVYSYKELLSDCPVFIYGEDDDPSFFDRCLEIEYLLGPIAYESSDGTDNIGTVNIKKIVKSIDFFRESTSRTDVACHLLKMCSGYNRTTTPIRKNVPLLQNLAGKYVPFCDLFRERPEDTTVYNSFCAAGYVPDVLEDSLFINSDEVWDWTVEHLEQIKALPDWETEHDGYLSSLVKVFKSEGEPSDRIALYLDEKGVPQDEKEFTIRSAETLSEEEYALLSAFSLERGYSIVPYSFAKLLCAPPFEIESVQFSDLIDDAVVVDPALFSIIAKVYDSLLHSYYVSPTENGGFSIRENDGRNYLCKNRDSAAEAALAAVDFNFIDENVQRYFSPTVLREYDITTNTGLMKRAIERLRGGNLPALLPLIKSHNEEIRVLFFQSLGDIEINDPVTEEDLRWKVIAYALSQISSSEFDYASLLLQKISHKGQRLPDTIKSSTVTFNGKEYDLYKLIGEAQTENELADSFFACIPDAELFRKSIYNNAQDSVSPEEIYDQLYETYLTVEQLRFCLDYSLLNNCSYKELEIAENESLSEALAMVSSENFVGFDEYFSINGFDKDVQVFADKSLLVEEEALPAEVQAWLERDPRAITLIRGLRCSSDGYIAIRAALRDNEAFYLSTDVSSDLACLKRTVEWITMQKYSIPFLYRDNRFSTISELIKHYPQSFNSTDPLFSLLKISGKVIKIDEEESLGLTFCDLSAEASLISEFDAYQYIPDILKHAALKKYFTTNDVYLIPTEGNLLSDENLTSYPRIDIRLTAEEKPYKEFSNELYSQWKKKKESDGVRIFLSENPIGTLLTIRNKVNGEALLSVPTKDNLFGYDSDKKSVIIQHPNPDGLSEMKTLERASKDIFFFKDPFIALQGLYVDMIEQGLNPNEILGEDERKGSELAKQIGGDAIDKIAENADTIKDLVENLTEEQLKMVAENKDKLQNLLEDMAGDDDDESMESKVRKTIGYIGELIYKKYLEKNGVEYVWAAAEGVGDYDFKLIGQDGHPDIYVDVKTNLYSFVDNAVPFYIHKSQNRFMIMHPDDPFRIVRISLTDIKLKKSYEHIRDYFGAEADVELDNQLKKRCEKIAEDYWRGAKIQEFDAASPEYGIKIERKTRK